MEQIAQLLPDRARRRLGRGGARAPGRVRDGDALRAQRRQRQFISGAGGSRTLRWSMARTGGDGPERHLGASWSTAGTPGLSFGANEKKMGWNAQPTRAVIFDERPGAGRQPARRARATASRSRWPGLDGGRLNIAACSLGGAQAALDKARAYMRERQAFGKRARLISRRCSSSSPTWRPSWRPRGTCPVARRRGARREATPTRPMLCAMAKRFATDAGFEVANEALQLHGGYGYLTEYGIEKIVRDLRVHQILEGTNEIMRVIVARRS